MKQRVVLFIFLSLFLQQTWSKVMRTVSVSLVEEKVNGVQFSHRIDVVDGVKKEQWTINAKSVDRGVYDQRILEAELEERRIEREVEYTQRVRMAEFKHEARSQALKRLLYKLVQQVEHGLKKFEKYEISPFIAYKPETIASEVDFSNITTYVVSPARDLLVSHFDPELAKDTIEKLEAYPEKLATLFEDSVTSAIDKCDDPKKLKGWLEMLS